MKNDQKRPQNSWREAMLNRLNCLLLTSQNLLDSCPSLGLALDAPIRHVSTQIAFNTFPLGYLSLSWFPLLAAENSGTRSLSGWTITGGSVVLSSNLSCLECSPRISLNQLFPLLVTQPPSLAFYHTTIFQYLLAIFKYQNLKHIVKLLRLKICLSCPSASLEVILYYTLCISLSVFNTA